MYHAIAAGLASFVFIFLKAFQQRNVAFDAPPAVVVCTSLCMACAEVYVVSAIATQGYSLPLVACIGLGAGIGSVCAMRLHRRIFGKQEGPK